MTPKRFQKTDVIVESQSDMLNASALRKARNPLAVLFSGASVFALALGLCLTASTTKAWSLTPNALEDYNQAEAAERSGDLQVAEQKIRQSIAQDPDDYLNLLKLGALLNQEGKPNEALTYYQRASSLNPQDVMVLYSMGGIYEQLQQFDKAEQAYALTLQNNPTYRFSLMSLARVEIQQKKYKPAIGHFKTFLEAYPDQFEARRRLAKLYLVTGDNSNAIQQYQTLKAKFPTQFSDEVDLARALNGAHEPEEALQELKAAYAREGSKSDISEEMGKAHLAMGQPDMAVDNFERAYTQSPEKDYLLLRIANLQRAQKQLPEAIGNYQHYLQVHPEDTDVKRSLADSYLDSQQYQPALENLNSLLETTQDGQARYDLRKDIAYATQMQGDLSGATSQYESLLAEPQAETDLQLKSNLALAYHKAGDFDKAVPLYKQVYYADPTLQKQYQIDRTQLGSDLSVALTALADASYRANNLDAALTGYNDAALYAPKTSTAPALGLGNTYYAMNVPDKAYEAYGRVLAVDPRNVTAKLYRTKLDIAKAPQQPGNVGNPSSIAALETLAKENPGNSEVLITLADVYAQQGNSTGAMNLYTQALQQDPKNVNLMVAAATQAQQSGSMQQAKDYYTQAEMLDSSRADVHYNLGIVYNELGDLQRSADEYQQALTINPQSSDSRYGLAVTQEKQNRYQDALENYQRYSQDHNAKYFSEAQSRIQILRQALATPATSVDPAYKSGPVVKSVPQKPAPAKIQPLAPPVKKPLPGNANTPGLRPKATDALLNPVPVAVVQPVLTRVDGLQSSGVNQTDMLAAPENLPLLPDPRLNSSVGMPDTALASTSTEHHRISPELRPRAATKIVAIPPKRVIVKAPVKTLAKAEPQNDPGAVRLSAPAKTLKAAQAVADKTAAIAPPKSEWRKAYEAKMAAEGKPVIIPAPSAQPPTQAMKPLLTPVAEKKPMPQTAITPQASNAAALREAEAKSEWRKGYEARVAEEAKEKAAAVAKPAVKTSVAADKSAVLTTAKPVSTAKSSITISKPQAIVSKLVNAKAASIVPVMSSKAVPKPLAAKNTVSMKPLVSKSNLVAAAKPFMVHPVAAKSPMAMQATAPEKAISPKPLKPTPVMADKTTLPAPKSEWRKAYEAKLAAEKAQGVSEKPSVQSSQADEAGLHPLIATPAHHASKMMPTAAPVSALAHHPHTAQRIQPNEISPGALPSVNLDLNPEDAPQN